MKKLLVLLMSLFMVIGLTACGPAKSPSEFMAEEFEKMKPEIKNIVMENSIEGKNELTEMGVDVEKFIETFMTSFEYEVLSEEVDGSNANVNVKIKNYDIGEIFDDVIKKVMNRFVDSYLTGEGEMDESQAEKEYAEALNNIDLSNYERKVEKEILIPMSKKAGVWHITDDGVDKISNALYEDFEKYDYEARAEEIVEEIYSQRQQEIMDQIVLSELPSDGLMEKFVPVKITESGTDYEGEQLESILAGIGDTSLNFYEDGSVALEVFGEILKCEDTGSALSVAGSEIAYTRDGDVITIDLNEINGVKIVFEKEQ